MDQVNNHYLWVEKYRPRTVNECILPESLKLPFQEFVKQGHLPNLLLPGTSGIGKTTIARAVCDEIGADWIIINGSDEGRFLETVRNKIRGFASTVSLTGGHKVVIIDEADNTTQDVQLALRAAIEEFSSNCSFIFTCNYIDKILPAIHSRCSVIEFRIRNGDKAKMATLFLKRLENILKENNIKYDIKVLVELIQKHFPDFRRILNECQRYSAGGVIDVGILSQLDTQAMKDLVGFLKRKEFKPMRKWVIANSDIDPSRIFRAIFDGMYDYLKPESIPQCVLTLSDYQNKVGFVADMEIHLVALMVELMGLEYV